MPQKSSVPFRVRVKKLLGYAGSSQLLSPIGQEKTGSSLWALLEHISIPALQFLAAIPLVYGLGLDGYGHWIYILAIASIAGSLAPGVAMAAIQLVAGQSDLTIRSAAVYLFLFGGLGTVLVFASIAGTIVFFILQHSYPTALRSLDGQDFAIATVVILSGAAMQWDLICAATLRAKLQYKTSSILDVSGRCIAVLAVGIMSVMQVGLFELLYVNSALILARAALKAYFATRIEVQPSLNTMRELLVPATKYSLLQWIQNSSAVSYQMADRIVVGLFVPPSLVAVAALASQVASQIHAVPRAFLAPLPPALITFFKASQLESFDNAIRNAQSRLRILQACLVPVILIMGPFAIATALNFESKFITIIPILISYLFGYLALSLTIVPYYSLIGEGRLALSGLVNALAGLLNLVGALTMGFLFGVVGVAISKALFALPYFFIGRARTIKPAA